MGIQCAKCFKKMMERLSGGESPVQIRICSQGARQGKGILAAGITAEFSQHNEKFSMVGRESSMVVKG